jgi:uncharacterized protein (DUF362 family)
MALKRSVIRRPLSRRQAIKAAAALASTPFLAAAGESVARGDEKVSRVLIVSESDPADAIARLLGGFDLSGFRGASIAVKANFNSDDPFPASTDPRTLGALIARLQDAGVAGVTLAERSGMGDTAAVLKARGIDDLARRQDFNIVNIEDLDGEGFIHHRLESMNWRRGILLARAFQDAGKVVQTCCLKTHRYGGHFTMALKNAVGAVAKFDPGDGYNYMRELHGSSRQRSMIAEISSVFGNDLIVMDARAAFVSGGPDRGKTVEPGLFLMSDDPVAIDAAGVAILRFYGTTREVSEGPVFEQEQIRRAGELGIGARFSREIQVTGLDGEAESFAARIRSQLG